jgi:mersacidin/lichenicidin family type 2 lantibiotic
MHDKIRAWKDEDYREQIGADLTAHPAGHIDLSALGGQWAKTTPTGTECPTNARSCIDIPVSACHICTTVYCFDTAESLAWSAPELVDA